MVKIVYQQKIESLNNFLLYDRATRVCCNDPISKHGELSIEQCRKLLLFKANSEPFHQTVSKQLDRFTILSLMRLRGSREFTALLPKTITNTTTVT